MKTILRGIVLASLLTATSARADDELGTVTLVGCGGLAHSHVVVKWDSGKTNVAAYCPPAGFPIGFAKGDRVKMQNGVLVKVSGSALPSSPPFNQPVPAPPPAPSATRGTVTGVTVSVKMDDGTTREIQLPAGTAPSIGAKVEVTGSSIKPVGK